MASKASQSTTNNSPRTNTTNVLPNSKQNNQPQPNNTSRSVNQNLTNGTNPLLISSSHLLSSMPGLVAAAVAGITTLIPLNAQLQAHSNDFSNMNNLTNNSGTSAVASSSSSSSEASTPATVSQALENNKNSTSVPTSSITNCTSNLNDQVLFLIQEKCLFFIPGTRPNNIDNIF